jgi:hypothetical protein
MTMGERGVLTVFNKDSEHSLLNGKDPVFSGVLRLLAEQVGDLVRLRQRPL